MFCSQPSNFIKPFVFLILLTLFPLPALSDWQVIPIRLDFDQRNRSGVITLSNNGEEAIAFTVNGVEWSQDEFGHDRYAPANDLIFFPKALTIPAKQERVVRAGIKTPAVNRERTYRLFIKEVPEPTKTDGTAVSIAIQFGVPIFAKPVKEDVSGSLTAAISPEGSQIEVTLVNNGNVHFRTKDITLAGKDATGKEIMSQQISGWYLLAGSERIFVAPMPAELCPDITSIDIQANARQITLNGKIDVAPSICPTP